MAKTELFVRKQSGGMFSVVNESLTTGSMFFVDSVTGSSSGGHNPDAPAATIAQAYALCTAGKGDRIYLMPGHAENISHATTSLSCTKADVQIIGLGDGDARPAITLDTANTASIAVSAASNSFQNTVFVANFLSIAACFTLSTAKAFAVRNCEFRDTSGILNFLNIVKGTGAANTTDRLNLQDNIWRGLGTTSVNSFALIADAINGVILRRNRVTLERTADAAALLTQTTGACTNLDCWDNVTVTKQTAVTAGGTLLNVGALSTGTVGRNYTGTLVTTGDKLFTTTVGLFPFENRVSGVVGATGFVIPAVDS